MTGNEYQNLCLRTSGALTPTAMLVNGMLGLNGEAGESADLILECLMPDSAERQLAVLAVEGSVISGQISDIIKKTWFQGHVLQADELTYLSDCLTEYAVKLRKVSWALSDSGLRLTPPELNEDITELIPLDDLEEELGDVMWYIATTAAGAGISLDDVMDHNIAKLCQRYPDGFDAERSIHRDEK